MRFEKTSSGSANLACCSTQEALVTQVSDPGALMAFIYISYIGNVNDRDVQER